MDEDILYKMKREYTRYSIGKNNVKKSKKRQKKVLTHGGKADIINFAAADAAVSKEESKGLCPEPKSRGKGK